MQLTVDYTRLRRFSANLARVQAEVAISRKPAHDGEPRLPITYRATRPGADLSNAKVHFDAKLNLFAHEPAPLPRPAHRPHRTYRMWSEAHGPFHTIFDRATGVPIATLRGDREHVEHQVRRYARSLRATSHAFLVTPCIAPDHGGDWRAADDHVRGSYVSP